MIAARRLPPAPVPTSDPAGRSSAVDKAAERLLVRLALQGPLASVSPDGTSDENALLGADLAVRRDRKLEITEAGRAHLVRAAIARAGAPIDPFLGQHIGLASAEIETATGRAALAIDAAESPLAWLARRKGRDGRALIEPAQLQAGERLRADVTLAHMLPRITANWTSSVARGRRADQGGMNYSEIAIAARQRVDRALGALGSEFSGLVLDVCCFLKGLEDVERERQWPPRSAKVVLQLGLDRLVRHYGYAAEARGRPRVPVRNWRAPIDECAGMESRME